MILPVAKESWPYIIPVGIAAILLFLLRSFVAGSVALLILLLFIYFFRDPERRVPSGEGLILAPADGRVVQVSFLGGEEEGDGILISIFLSLLDVHVNRSPAKGIVSGVVYQKGSFHLAFRNVASGENEQNIIALAHDGDRITLKQIAGIIARRVVCWVQPGEEVEAGQRIGLIKFGSRVDLILPKRCTIAVKKGDRVRGGITVIGYLK
jgi:phosphatidylserine decarboxylase